MLCEHSTARILKKRSLCLFNNGLYQLKTLKSYLTCRALALDMSEQKRNDEGLTLQRRPNSSRCLTYPHQLSVDIMANVLLVTPTQIKTSPYSEVLAFLFNPATVEVAGAGLSNAVYEFAM